MAIRTYIKDGKKLYEAYINGFNSRGVRVQRKRKGIETLRKAEIIEFELKRELAKLKEEKVPYRWSEWLEECLKRMRLNYRPSTIMGYETQMGKWINPKWNSRDLNQITKQDVYDVIFMERESKLTPWSIKSLLKMVRRIFQMAIEEGILDKNPCSGIKVNVPEVDQKVLTKVEAEIFLREAKLTNHRFYSIWAMALMTGMRSGELFALKWTDIDFEGKTISVSKQWTSKNGYGPTKTQRGRIVPISNTLLKFLKELKMRSGSKSEFILPQLPEWENGEQARVTRDFCTALGITPVKFHDLRATFITNLLARGEPLARVMAIVGHSQIKTTNGYLRKAGVDVAGATERLSYELPEDVEYGKILSLK